VASTNFKAPPRWPHKGRTGTSSRSDARKTPTTVVGGYESGARVAGPVTPVLLEFVAEVAARDILLERCAVEKSRIGTRCLAGRA